MSVPLPVAKVQAAMALVRSHLRHVSNLGLKTSATLFLAEASMRRPIAPVVRRFAPPFLSIHPAGYRSPLTIRRASSDSAVIRQILGVDAAYRWTPTTPDTGLVLDCGANIGASAYYFLHRYPRARVIAVEPDLDNWKLCRRNLAPFGDRAIVLHAALWSECRPLRIVPASRSAGDWALRVEPVTPAVADTEGLTVVEILKRAGQSPPIDVLKIDIEGAEIEVFRDCEEWLAWTRHIAIELHSKEADAVFTRALSGFACRRWRQGEVTFVDALTRIAALPRPHRVQ